MPPSIHTLAPHSVFGRDNIVGASNPPNALEAAQVVCAWPVSGQYGFGTRVLYYVLVVTCVLARRKPWLRNACLAAALLLPAVAAIHAIVLAAVHMDKVVDMDIYGAFQICSIGILAAPVTVYNSKTYFNDPGRNIIFIWTGLLLAGMLSLAVEFFRIEAHDCMSDLNGGRIDPFNSTRFPYGNVDCNLGCAYDLLGPLSRIRQDPTNEPSVIPVPTRLTFAAVALLAAGSSIPPVLTLMFTWERILEINWRRTFANEETRMNAPIEGTNGATPKTMNFINGAIRSFLSSIQIPIFSGIVLVLLVLGELNFWSPQVKFNTEPFSSIGQWANVVATVLVILGSLFYVQDEREIIGEEVDISSNLSHSTRGRKAVSPNTHSSGRDSVETETVRLPMSDNHRNRIATLLYRFGEYLETPAPDRYDNSVFRKGQNEFPVIPAEYWRVPNLGKIKDGYRSSRRQDDDEISIPPRLSRGSFSSNPSVEVRPSERSPSPSCQPQAFSRSNTMPDWRSEYSSGDFSGMSVPTVVGPGSRPRRDTLEVPKPAFFRPSTSTPAETYPATFRDTTISPKIVVSAEPEET